ncbi:tripartite tricarboxylate transporter TctB family protein [Kushneria sinocarnis]|uniref:Tripartite tricarboxylate transporter TctB family protein n=1 Tax=Kushneria sinocarnis TaxID=595502 RepID=A0A420WWD0_9GAMM|nr:tripartite tricarboxylate transporter TctB family protein [Kushneria sinocarnis]RKR03426.1 tripartite tricarboxylate transporter TctB family protein [Kushneria sinocarnis]
MSQEKLLKPGERTFNLLLLVLSAGVLYEAYQISGFDLLNAPGAFPLILGMIMIIAMLVILAEQRHRSGTATSGVGNAAKQFIQCCCPREMTVFTAMAIIYLALLHPLGFLPATILFLFLSQLYLRSGKMMASGIITIITTIVIYALFKIIFQVYLP